ncbi:synaptotagmin beta [Calliopsis andreniformis]|uniref:synaptotagmin beta n=1 Tax=Calliopsis andreniformis TaxID=337506 RepID=UPI003FCCF18B
MRIFDNQISNIFSRGQKYIKTNLYTYTNIQQKKILNNIDHQSTCFYRSFTIFHILLNLYYSRSVCPSLSKPDSLGHLIPLRFPKCSSNSAVFEFPFHRIPQQTICQRKIITRVESYSRLERIEEQERAKLLRLDREPFVSPRPLQRRPRWKFRVGVHSNRMRPTVRSVNPYTPNKIALYLSDNFDAAFPEDRLHVNLGTPVRLTFSENVKINRRAIKRENLDTRFGFIAAVTLTNVDVSPAAIRASSVCLVNARRLARAHEKSALVLDTFVKVPSKLSEVLGDVLELACGGSGGGSGRSGGSNDGAKSGNSTIGTAASRIGVVTGVASIRDKWAQRGHRSPLSSVANTDSADSTTSTSSEEFNVAKEKHAVQPCASVVVESVGLPHQSRSYPGGSTSGSGGSMGRLFTRNSSVSSQSSLEGASGPSSHRGSSPQIRAFGPDGRYHHRDPLHAASSYPPSRSSRSPSPGRAASLDARCGSPASCSGSLLSSNASRSQSSLSSLATGVSSSCGGSSISVAHGASRSAGRSLSPLLIPPMRNSGSSDGGPAPPASPLGSIQPDLYQRRDGPIYLKTRGYGKSLGRLHLRFKYDFDRSDLHVHVIEAHDLARSGQGGFNDPYVKLMLTPEVDSRKRQTQKYRDDASSCPFFDQQFKFPVSNDELHDKILVLQVLDYDSFSRNDIVGSVKVPLHILRLDSPTSTEEVWGEIERERKPPEQIQEVLLSLSYLPIAERLKVVILKARNLFPPQEKGTLDSFVKVNLLCGEKRVKKKTAVRKATTSPVWNEAMSFDVPASSLASSAIEVRVMDSSNEFIGGNVIVGSCIVGPATGSIPGAEDSGSQGREHWLHMTQSPRKTIAMWHTLR